VGCNGRRIPWREKMSKKGEGSSSQLRSGQFSK
jgi:hypothetical protein